MTAARPADIAAAVEPGPLGAGPRLMITAAEAYPVLERLFLEAREEVCGGFRIFDPQTPLYSEAARAVGADWFDLVEHTLRRGVDIDLVLCDFDPVVGAEVHRGTWRSIRGLLAAAEIARAAGAAGRLRVTAAMHPARVGALPRSVLYGHIAGEVNERLERLRALAASARDRALAEMPGFARWIGRDGLTRRRLALPELIPVTHHQKLAVFDRERLYIGGLDLNERRFDSPAHERPGPETWHDIQVLVGEAEARAAHAHLGRFLDEVAGRRDIERGAGPLLRTLSRRRSWTGLSMSPESQVTEIADAHHAALDRTERFVYLETQFLRDRRFASHLARRAAAAPGLRCIVVLPAAPEEVALQGRSKLDMRFGEFLQARALRKLRRAFGARLAVVTPARPVRAGPAPTDRAIVRGAPLVYVHAKVSIFDDHTFIVSSANLNGRSMRWDTEAGVAIADPEAVRAFRARLMRHWLPADAGGEAISWETAPGVWRRLAAENAARPPQDRRGFLMPYEDEHGARFGRALPGVPEEMV